MTTADPTEHRAPRRAPRGKKHLVGAGTRRGPPSPTGPLVALSHAAVGAAQLGTRPGHAGQASPPDVLPPVMNRRQPMRWVKHGNTRHRQQDPQRPATLPPGAGLHLSISEKVNYCPSTTEADLF